MTQYCIYYIIKNRKKIDGFSATSTDKMTFKSEIGWFTFWILKIPMKTPLYKIRKILYNIDI